MKNEQCESDKWKGGTVTRESVKNRIFLMLAILGALTLVGCATIAKDRARLKEEIKREILAELRAQETATASVQAVAGEERPGMKEEREPKLLAKVEEQDQTPVLEIPSEKAETVQEDRGAVGNAEGRILRSGQGLPGCRVKLVRLIKMPSLSGMFGGFEQGTEFLTVTDEEGKYRFDNLPVGEYKVKWELPQDKGWIRRLRDKPDVSIEVGKTSFLKEIETNRVLVPH